MRLLHMKAADDVGIVRWTHRCSMLCRTTDPLGNSPLQLQKASCWQFPPDDGVSCDKFEAKRVKIMSSRSPRLISTDTIL